MQIASFESASLCARIDWGGSGRGGGGGGAAAAAAAVIHSLYTAADLGDPEPPTTANLTPPHTHTMA